jgi:hypothetical protein
MCKETQSISAFSHNVERVICPYSDHSLDKCYRTRESPFNQHFVSIMPLKL